MKVIHVALNNKRQTALCDALASLGEYKEIDWCAEERRIGLDRFQQFLIDEAQAFRPDIIFMQLQNDKVVRPETAKQLPGFIMNWTGDVRQPTPQWYIDLGRVIDRTLFTNTADVEALRKAGCKADYLQIGFDPNVFCKTGIEKSGPEIVFLGNNYHNGFPLSQLRSDMVQRLYNVYGDRFQVYGAPWNVPSKTVEHNTKEECEIYQRAKIAINISHFDLGRYSSDRIHSIMASGAFCLTKWYPEIEKEFTPGEHVGVWHDLDELISLVDFYLKLDHTRESIAQRGYELVHSRDTWAARIQELKKMLP